MIIEPEAWAPQGSLLQVWHLHFKEMPRLSVYTLQFEEQQQRQAHMKEGCILSQTQKRGNLVACGLWPLTYPSNARGGNPPWCVYWGELAWGGTVSECHAGSKVSPHGQSRSDQ